MFRRARFQDFAHEWNCCNTLCQTFLFAKLNHCFETPLTDKPETLSILRHLHSKPGHDEVKADFRQLLVVEFGVALTDLDFEKRVPEVKVALTP